VLNVVTAPADSGRGECGVKAFVYGILFGAAGMYLYFTQGAFVDATVNDLFSWRNSARASVYGYGGSPKPKQ